ncbi:Putative SOS response-associated peptidase YedK [Planctomycetes bacterium Pla163]|uniref:Abasic site processing protein n=1 Tax=Rohdeia mirabilis TaxID=2528008 RepID=A0A518CYI1_9BACT|nr:Putative SOS response-associated peptidase YedK [Planctomycetes bacterium Pla163]
MCGGYTTPDGWQELRIEFATTAFQLERSWAVRPFDSGPIVTSSIEDGVVARRADQWSLVPHFAKERRLRYSTFNARLDKLTSSPIWRSAFPKRRCLVPADGFFERVPEPGEPKKRPYWVRFADRSPFCFAGLWSEWTDPQTGEIVTTYTVVTTRNNALMEAIGHPRMPAIVHPDRYGLWLDPTCDDTDALRAAIEAPVPGNLLDALPISHKVNFRGEHGPDIVEPIGPAVTVDAA